MELVHIVSGHRSYRVGEATLEAFGGEIVVLPDGVRHVQHTMEDTVTQYVTFRGFHGILDDRLRSVHVGDDIITRWMADLIASRDGTAPLSMGCQSALAMAILQRLADIEHAEQPYHPAVHAALGCMRQRLADPKLCLQGLAQDVGLSTSHLSLLFRQHLRSSPMRILEQMRLDRAKQLLESPYDTIKMIASACGYRQSSYFCRVFRAQVGSSPGLYRQNHIKEIQSQRNQATPPAAVG